MVDVTTLTLDGVTFTDVRVVEARMWRELAVSTGRVAWTETAWSSRSWAAGAGE